jgi:hypothetical protein
MSKNLLGNTEKRHSNTEAMPQFSVGVAIKWSRLALLSMGMQE